MRNKTDAHLRVNESIKENRQWGILDVGANIGTITVPAAQILSRFGLGSVIAVEAIPLHVVLLRKSIKQNSLDNILVIRHAISDKPGLNLELKINPGNRGGTSAFGLDMKDPGKAEIVSAITVTVDQIYEMYKERLKNTLIWKLDVECYEGYAFAGASKFLKEVKPCWIMAELKVSCLDSNGPLKYQEILNLLEKYGYHIDFHGGYGGEDYNFRHRDCCKEHETCIFK